LFSCLPFSFVSILDLRILQNSLIQDEFDAPVIIERAGAFYNLISQNSKTVAYEELFRLNRKLFISTDVRIETSKKDLWIRINQGDIDVIIPSLAFFRRLQEWKVSRMP